MYQRDAFARVLPAPPAAPAPASGPSSTRTPVLIAYATQTGAAAGYAQATDEQLRAAGIASRMVAFDDLHLDTLTAARQVMFVASTTYDGDPPDMAEEFALQYMGHPASLPSLQYGLLALGDSDYDAFCGFGRYLHQWLQASGAHPLFAPVEVDDENADALDHWFRHVDVFARAQTLTHAVAAPGVSATG